MRPDLARLRFDFGATLRLSVLVSAVFLAVCGPAFATATDLTLVHPGTSHAHLIARDDNSAGLPFLLSSFNGLVMEDEVDEAGESRGLDLVRRAPDGAWPLANNEFRTREIKMGETQWFYLPKSAIDNANGTSSEKQSNSTSKRATTTVYLSLTICSKPSLKESDPSNSIPDLPQLDIYVSTDSSLQKPGPGNDEKNQTVYRSVEGYMGAEVSAEGDIYIGVAARENESYFGSYSYQIAASTDAFFHGFDDQVTLFSPVDSGSDAALLATTIGKADSILTDEQQKLWKGDANTTVYTMFVNKANSPALAGIQQSYCALEKHSQIRKGKNLTTSMTNTTRDFEKEGLQQQFYVTGLDRSSTYVAVLGMTGNSTKSGNGVVGGGGKVWQPKSFTTKTDQNCAVVYDLSFCSDVARAVPSHPSFNLSGLRAFYDDRAASLYKNFSYSLQQVQCNTSNETIFSMAVSCTDCANAYKSWLCNVTIPQCADFSSDPDKPHYIRNAGQPFPNGTSIIDKTLTENAATNSSRHPFIDQHIKPGPYKELLPSIDVCHDLVKKCPMTLEFKCPNRKRREGSYGPPSASSDESIASSWKPLTLTSVVAAASVSGLLWVF